MHRTAKEEALDRRSLGPILGRLLRPELRRLVLPFAIRSWSLTSLQQRLFKTGGPSHSERRYFVLPTDRQPFDTQPLSADSPAHRAPRVAPRVITNPRSDSDGECVTAIFVRRLIEQRLLDPGEGGSRYWPEFVKFVNN